MDKCILKNDDVKALFAWRDRNKDLVRRGANPMKGIEIVLPDIKAKAKYIRENNIVKIFAKLKTIPFISLFEIIINPFIIVNAEL